MKEEQEEERNSLPKMGDRREKVGGREREKGGKDPSRPGNRAKIRALFVSNGMARREYPALGESRLQGAPTPSLEGSGGLIEKSGRGKRGAET